MDEAKLKALLAEATAHCFDEEDEFWGMFSALVRGLSFPLQATVSGEAVTLTGLDGHTSDLQAGVMAQAQLGDAERSVPLAEVEPVDADPGSTEWLAAYRYWFSKTRG
jgi:hypothetical protein